MFRFALFTLAALSLAGCKEDGPDFTEHVYVKDDARNRVFILEAQEPITAEQAHTEAKSKMNTERQFTVVFIYEPGTYPEAGPKGGSDAPFTDGMDLALSSPLGLHRYYYSMAPTGNEDFLDCKGADSGNTACQRP